MPNGTDARENRFGIRKLEDRHASPPFSPPRLPPYLAFLDTTFNTELEHLHPHPHKVSLRGSSKDRDLGYKRGQPCGTARADHSTRSSGSVGLRIPIRILGAVTLTANVNEFGLLLRRKYSFFVAPAGVQEKSPSYAVERKDAYTLLRPL